MGLFKPKDFSQLQNWREKIQRGIMTYWGKIESNNYILDKKLQKQFDNLLHAIKKWREEVFARVAWDTEEIYHNIDKMSRSEIMRRNTAKRIMVNWTIQVDDSLQKKIAGHKIYVMVGNKKSQYLFKEAA